VTAAKDEIDEIHKNWVTSVVCFIDNFNDRYWKVKYDVLNSQVEQSHQSAAGDFTDLSDHRPPSDAQY
jgi:hypothetical protein